MGILYKCLITGDEMITDDYKPKDFDASTAHLDEELKAIDEYAKEIDAKLAGGGVTPAEKGFLISQKAACGDAKISVGHLKEASALGSKTVFRFVAEMKAKPKELQLNIGANPSAEEEEEQMDDDDAAGGPVYDIPDNFRYNKMDSVIAAKKDLGFYVKKYAKALEPAIAANEKTKAEKAASYKTTYEPKSADDIKAIIKDILLFTQNVVGKNFKAYEFYSGEGEEAIDGMLPMCCWENRLIDGKIENQPVFYFWKHGLSEEKV